MVRGFDFLRTLFLKGIEYMNSEASKFATYLKENNVDSFKFEELHDEHDSVIFSNICNSVWPVYSSGCNY